MRPVQFSGYQTINWGNARVMINDSGFEPEVIQQGIKKIGTPFQASKDSFILLHRVGGNQAASVQVEKDGPVKGFLVEYGKSDYMKILTEIAQYMTGKFPKN